MTDTASKTDTAASAAAGTAATDHPILRHFAHEHLPAHLAEVSKPVGDLARHMHANLPNGPEKSAGLRKLLEAKDAFVRARVEAGDASPADNAST